MPPKFVHLHTHTHYSLLDGLSKIPELLDYTKELGMDAIALTDHGVLYGAIEFYKEAKKRGIKPIIGMEAYVASGSMRDKNPNVDDKRYHLTLLAKNKQGYENLIKLSTRAHLEGYYYKPRVDKKLLNDLHEGIIALSGCLNGEIPKRVLAGTQDQAKQTINEYEEIFGKGNFYLEIQYHKNIPDQHKLNKKLIALSRAMGTPLVATQDSHYLRPDDAEAQDVLLAIQTGNKISDENRMTMKDDDFSLASPADMRTFFADVPEALENTEKIADACDLEIELGNYQLPVFDVPEGYTDNSYLTKLCLEGLEKRYGIDGSSIFNFQIPISKQFPNSNDQKQAEIAQRLDYELGVIKKTGFASYFLIVQDFVNWAKNHGIVVGPGRGSAAGSIVAYLLNITNIDPLRYELLFERFLNPERISMPDIDLDFTDTRRDEVLEYVAQKYGRDRVAQIITFGTMAARVAIRDVGRVLDYEYGYCDKLAKMVPLQTHITLGQALKEVEELRELYREDPRAKKLLDIAQRLEGVARHASTHACGVVIAKNPLDEMVPCQFPTQNDKTVISQYDMHAVEDLGLLKIDFLGLKNLTIIEHALAQIKKRYGIEIVIDDIPLDDKKTIELLQQAHTTGVFQLESSGIKRYLKELKPTSLEDIIAMVALYRPGPMELIPDFIDRKHGRKSIRYLHPKLEPILQKTYGIAVYQEQVLQIARQLAGFSFGEADVLRKAIGKKIRTLLEEQKVKFIAGVKANGIDEKIGEQLFQFIEPFARYGFNRCVSGDTHIIDIRTGIPIKIEELASGDKKISGVLSLEKNLQLKKHMVSHIFSNGKKRVWKITTRSGRIIRATANHPFLAARGWKNLEDIAVGEKIAIARTIPAPQKTMSLPPYKLGVLGYLLAEGNLCHPSGFYFYSKSAQEVKDYVVLLEQFPNTVAKIDTSKPAVAVYAKRKDSRKPSAAVQWIESLGLKYKKATEKFFPPCVYSLPDEDLAMLLAKMFQGDGCISCTRKDPQIFYATSSVTIAQELQHLFLRFGILSSVHIKKFRYRGGIKIGYTVTISRYDNIEKFIRVLGSYFVGQKAKNCTKILREHPILNHTFFPWVARGSYDTVPIAVAYDVMRDAVQQRYATLQQFEKATHISQRLLGYDARKQGYLRETLQYVAQKTHHKKLMQLGQSHIYWDRITSIEDVGIEETYDITVESTHNFVANDFIVHNSHAACYAMIAFQTAYLKAHYPVEFMAALLNAEEKNIERIAFLIDECKKMNIEVLPPDINESYEDFSSVGNTSTNGDAQRIRFGLAAIKNVGRNVVEEIIRVRSEAGGFSSVQNFLDRLETKDVNKKSLESLIRAGAFDGLENRTRLSGNIETLLQYNRDRKNAAKNNQPSLFGEAHAAPPPLQLSAVPPIPESDMLTWEKELLGLYVSSHPLQQYAAQLAKFIPIKSLAARDVGRIVHIGGIITSAKKIVTKSGKPMLFAQIEDLGGKIEAVVFPSTFEGAETLLQENARVYMRGRINDKDGEIKIICEEVKKL